jgi:hypothetical protein
MRGVMWFGKKRKLSPQFIGLFEITKRVRKLVYKIALPRDLVGTHDVFHVSMQRKYIANPGIIVEYKPFGNPKGINLHRETSEDCG